MGEDKSGWLVVACGSREFPSEEEVDDAIVCLDQLLGRFLRLEPIKLLHGDCRGPDRWAGESAERLLWEVEAIQADWNGIGKGAGFVRNRALIERLRDWPNKDKRLLIAFWDGYSRGTRMMLKLAREFRIPTDVVVRYR